MTTYPHEFSLKEANALIPELEKRLKNLITQKETYTKEHDYLFMSELLETAEKEIGKQKNNSGLDQEALGVEKSLADFEKEVEAIREMGCVIRDLEKGWVDFLGKKDGKLVYFSWRLGEKEINYYHETDESAEERRLV